ncbi:MAG: hypothetical protein RLZZ579_21 [Actinomycetota bacterium]|jgi:DNA-3-methyladenine glycosylase I
MKIRKLADGITRCGWVSDDQIYIDYHDREWGQPTKNQRDLFEAICLEGFQAGLSWLTILKRRQGFRDAFDNFDSAKVAKYGKREINRLLKDEGIIRNLAKINSAINNAKVVEDNGINLVETLWSFAPAKRVTRRTNFEWVATSKDAEAMSKHLKKLGFSFVGPTTMYALMQSTGMIFDHAPGCFKKP